MKQQSAARRVQRTLAQWLIVPAILAASAVAMAQAPSLPRSEWLANIKPVFVEGFCADGAPFRQLYAEAVATCPGRVADLFDECATRTPEVLIPETIVGLDQGSKYGSILGECMSAHYVGGDLLSTFNAMQAVTNGAPGTATPSATGATCASPPAGTVSALGEPYARWASISCDDLQRAYVLAAAEGYIWTIEQNGGFSPQHKSVPSYGFSAAGPVPVFFAPTPDRPNAPRYRFVKQVPSVMTEQQLSGVNRLLPAGTAPYQTVHQLDLNTSTGLIYSFFIYLREASPEWIVACVNYQCGRRATVRVTRR